MTTGSVYGDDASIEDKLSCDLVEVICPCGHRASLLWGTWPASMRVTPLRLIQPKLACGQCKARRSTISILSYAGGGMRTVWQWPRA
jgi:hypothetical protein